MYGSQQELRQGIAQDQDCSSNVTRYCKGKEIKHGHKVEEQIRSDQIRSDQIRSDQIRSDHAGTDIVGIIGIVGHVLW